MTFRHGITLGFALGFTWATIAPSDSARFFVLIIIAAGFATVALSELIIYILKRYFDATTKN